jgi:SnoaL-like domain
MSLKKDSHAVKVAQAHVQAWSEHDLDTARKGLAAGVRVTVTTTKPAMADTSTTGVDAYMQGLAGFIQAVVPGSARMIASTGDDHNALLMVSVEADFGGGKVTVPAARLYLIDDADKVKVEQVVFLIPD